MKKEYLIMAGSIIVIAGVVLFVLMPAWDSYNQDKATVSDRQSQIDSLKKFNDKLNTLSQKYNIDPGQFDKFVAALPQGNDLPQLLTQLENLATENSIIMDSVDFHDVTQVAMPVVTNENNDTSTGVPAVPSASAPTPNDYKTLSIGLKLTGSWSAFQNYLQSVEKSDRLMDIATLSYSGTFSQSGGSQSQGDKSAGSDFSITLNVYYR